MKEKFVLAFVVICLVLLVLAVNYKSARQAKDDVRVYTNKEMVVSQGDLIESLGSGQLLYVRQVKRAWGYKQVGDTQQGALIPNLYVMFWVGGRPDILEGTIGVIVQHLKLGNIRVIHRNDPEWQKALDRFMAP